MSNERPYEKIPTFSLIFLIERYEELIKNGQLNFRGELFIKNILKDINTELSYRITPEGEYIDFTDNILDVDQVYDVKEERHQITIDEYIRERSKGDGKI